MNSQELRDKSLKLITEATAAIKSSTDEGDAKHDELMAEAERLEARAVKLEAAEIRAAALNEASTARPTEDRAAARATETEADKEVRAYAAVLRGTATTEQRAILKTDGSTANLIPDTAASSIIDIVTKSSPLFDVITTFTTATGAPYAIPRGDDRSGVAYEMVEGEDAADTDFTFDGVTFGAREFSTGMVQVTRSMLQDDRYDLTGYVNNKFGIRLAKLWAQRITNGNGTTQMQGFVTGLTVANAVIESATSNAIVFSDLMKAEENLEEAYHDGATWLLNRKTLNKLRLIAASDGSPVVFQGNYANGAPNTILGKPYVVVNTLADDQIGFGNWKEAYAMRQVAGLSVATANELYIKKNTVGLIGFARADAKIINPAAALILKKKA
jgi:HK97 family phage major capsid protein